jgi:hypothetical protein
MGLRKANLTEHCLPPFSLNKSIKDEHTQDTKGDLPKYITFVGCDVTEVVREEARGGYQRMIQIATENRGSNMKRRCEPSLN